MAFLLMTVESIPSKSIHFLRIELWGLPAISLGEAAETAEHGPKYAPTGDSRVAQVQHLASLEAVKRYSGCTFASSADLAKHIAYTVILDLLVKAYAEEFARARDVAEGFIHEMAKKVAGDRNLDFEGKKRAVRNAIDIYEREIVGGQTQTNIDAIVDEALARARSLVDVGKSGLAQATLRRAAEAMRREARRVAGDGAARGLDGVASGAARVAEGLASLASRAIEFFADFFGGGSSPPPRNEQGQVPEPPPPSPEIAPEPPPPAGIVAPQHGTVRLRVRS